MTLWLAVLIRQNAMQFVVKSKPRVTYVGDSAAPFEVVIGAGSAGTGASCGNQQLRSQADAEDSQLPGQKRRAIVSCTGKKFTCFFLFYHFLSSALSVLQSSVYKNLSATLQSKTRTCLASIP